jgi:hypothetical protein
MAFRRFLFAALAAAAATTFGQAEEPKSAGAGEAIKLAGQIVAITLMSDSEDLVLLERVTETKLAGRTFLEGKGVDDGQTPDWRNGAQVFIPADDIQQLVVFRTLDDYRKNLDLRPDRLHGKAASHRVRVR